MRIEGIFSAIRASLGGLTAQMKRLQVISENISNAERVADESGNLYRKKTVVSLPPKESPQRSFTDHLTLRLRRSKRGHIAEASPHGSSDPRLSLDNNQTKIIQVGGERLVYNPSHPRANEQGYVRMPDVNIIEEMVDMVSASRAYEANITVMNGAKEMAKRALDI